MQNQSTQQGNRHMNSTYTTAFFPFMKALTSTGQHAPKETILSAHAYVSPRGRSLTPAQAEARRIAYALKQPTPEVAEQAAREMAPILHAAEPDAQQIILMPVPASTGSTQSNEIIAQALAAELRRHGRRVKVEITVGRKHPVESSCTRRKRGGRGLTLDQHNIIPVRPITPPAPGTAHYFVYNMATEGTTIQACQKALGHGKAIVYADKHRP